MTLRFYDNNVVSFHYIKGYQIEIHQLNLLNDFYIFNKPSYFVEKMHEFARVLSSLCGIINFI